MSQHDFDLTTADANTGVTVRAGMNAMAQALASCSSGATEPSTMYAYQFWADTTSGYMKQRNAANNAWLTRWLLSAGQTFTGGSLTSAINTARATVASAATTADIWGAAGNQIDWTGTVTCTGFPAAPQAGAERVLICAAAAPFTAGTNMLIDGVSSGNTVTCAANDQMIVRAVSTTQFKLSRVKYDGTAQVVDDSRILATKWNGRTSAADNDWQAIAWNGTVFAAVAYTGTGNRVMTSPDGITWTIRTSAADNSWNGIAWNGTVFAAVASTGVGNRVMTSPDGITWTIRTSAADNFWLGIAWNGTVFAAVAYTGTGNRVMTTV